MIFIVSPKKAALDNFIINVFTRYFLLSEIKYIFIYLLTLYSSLSTKDHPFIDIFLPIPFNIYGYIP